MTSPRSAPRTARERVRAQLTTEIVDVARTHLATSGAAALSLRAVARELGMVSSAVYRYFPSRDDLLTRLIVEGYDALGDAVEVAEATAAREDLLGRWHAACGAARTWALAHPHEYALLYGSPVPGYSAPQDTIAPAGRVAIVLARVVADGIASGVVAPPPGDDPQVMAPGLLDELGLPDDTGLGGRLVLAWSGLFGAIGFELFGHTHNVVVAHEAHFRSLTTRLAAEVGLPV
ncbi:TetR/AcrR family transcriptional regulator [Pseudonocardia sp. RS11V-5]|uniref:TetR/AcrR family transcriptional regulator n=1 Tax=Pseudonocardia terrae TaxID=2905831 RepID=UPI001E5556A5|nr:TetR/AcrR family transcriptional regulator [Pseudonocardia terrae]MCE3553739.1 TetR/AcrR family transcriptional regulator [Pseudonocardia terrae]